MHGTPLQPPSVGLSASVLEACSLATPDSRARSSFSAGFAKLRRSAQPPEHEIAVELAESTSPACLCFPERAEFPATTPAAWRLGFSATRLALNVRALWRFTVRKALHKSHESKQEGRGSRRASASTAIARALPLRIGAIRRGQRKVLENEFQTNVRSPSFGCFGLVFPSHMTVLPARASLKASTLQNKK